MVHRLVEMLRPLPGRQPRPGGGHTAALGDGRPARSWEGTPPGLPEGWVLTKCSQHQCVSSRCREGGFGLETSMR